MIEALTRPTADIPIPLVISEYLNLPIKENFEDLLKEDLNFDFIGEFTAFFRGYLKRKKLGLTDREALSLALEEKRGNILGQRIEMILRRTAIPGVMYPSYVKDSFDIIGIGGRSLDSIYDEKERGGVARDTWITQVKPLIQTAEDGGIIVLNSPAGRTSINEGDHFVLYEHHTRGIQVFKDQLGRVQTLFAFTLVSDLDLSESETLLKRLHLVKNSIVQGTDAERILGVCKTVAYMSPSRYQRGFLDLIDEISNVKKDPWFRRKPVQDLVTKDIIFSEAVCADQVKEEISLGSNFFSLDKTTMKLIAQYEKKITQIFPQILAKLVQCNITSANQIDRQLIEQLIKESSEAQFMFSSLRALLLKITKISSRGEDSSLVDRDLTGEESAQAVKKMSEAVGCPPKEKQKRDISKMNTDSLRIFLSLSEEDQEDFFDICPNPNCQKLINQVIKVGQACKECGKVRPPKPC